MRNLGWRTGRGFAPPKGGRSGWWFTWGWFRIEWHPKWWRLGLSVRAWTLGVYLGPLVIAGGQPQWRWRIQPAPASAGTGDSWQDHSWTVAVTTTASNQDASPATEPSDA